MGTKGQNHTCKRCGKCCQETGGSFWIHSEHELVKAMAKYMPVDFFRESGPCDMLLITENGRAMCLLQKWLGHKAKPQACRDYPFDGKPCFGEEDKEQ